MQLDDDHFRLADWLPFYGPEQAPRPGPGIFMAEAVRIMGRALDMGWDDLSPLRACIPWIDPPPDESVAFDGDRPVEAVHQRWAPTLQAIWRFAERYGDVPLSTDPIVWERIAREVTRGGDPMAELVAPHAAAASASLDPMDRQDWKAADFEAGGLVDGRRHCRRIMALVAAALVRLHLSGDIAVRALPPGSSTSKAVQPHEWGIDDALRAVASCSIATTDADGREIGRAWLFVSAEDFEEAVAAYAEVNRFVRDVELEPCDEKIRSTDRLLEDAKALLLLPRSVRWTSRLLGLALEKLDDDAYGLLPERRLRGIRALLLERGVMTPDELDATMRTRAGPPSREEKDEEARIRAMRLTRTEDGVEAE